MNLSKQKQYTKEFDLGCMVLLHSTKSIFDSFNLPDNIFYKAKDFIDFLEDYCYDDPDTFNPNGNGTELINEKYYCKTIYKNIL